jgi:hypothetical protein
MDAVLDFIRRELRYRLELADQEVLLESAAVLADESDTRGAVISLVNFKVSAYQGSGLTRPDLLDSMELLLLFSFRFRSYQAGLQNLYKTVRLFHEKPAYTAADTHPENSFPPHVEKLFFTLHPVELEALNDLWGTYGGLQCPSVLFSVRMVRSQRG